MDLDWRKYDELSNMQDIGRRKHNTFFTEIENECRIVPCSTDEHGTTIKIELGLLEQTWSEADIKRAYSELSKLVSPILKPTYPFRIVFHSNDYEDYVERDVKNDFNIETAHHYLLKPFTEGERTSRSIFSLTKRKDA